jgi:hypothetical protein
MNASNAFTFVPDTRCFAASDALVARVTGNISTPQQLFDLLYHLLTLPGYFGFNWNALSDCLRDFHWVGQSKVIIVHDKLPELPPSEMRTYLEVLRDAVVEWRSGEPHSLQVVFDERDRVRVEAAMTVALR